MKVSINNSQYDCLIDNKIYIKPGSGQTLVAGLELNYDEHFCMESPCYITGNNLYSMGAFSYSHSVFPINATIGRYCSIAKNVRIFGDEHPMERFTTSAITYNKRFNMFKTHYDSKDALFGRVPLEPAKPIVIGNDVWIGDHVALKPGITIGDGAVVATGAIVTKDVPPYTIVGGVPSKPIRKRFEQDIIDELLRIRWWDYDWTDFNISADMPIEEFIKYINEMIFGGKIFKYDPKKITKENLIDKYL